MLWAVYDKALSVFCFNLLLPKKDSDVSEDVFLFPTDEGERIRQQIFSQQATI